MRSFVILLVLACALSPPARADLECMARFGSGWSSWLPTGAEIEANDCAKSLQYPGLISLGYRLTRGPVRGPSRITCQWSYIPSQDDLLTPFGAPESIVCNLFLPPPLKSRIEGGLR